MPKINELLAGARVAVLSYQQDVAILNRMNYAPHPAFQNYSAYTPELQRLNEDFFGSGNAPEYVLWRFGTIDARFPTLDDGASLLRILSDYSPVLQEQGYVLWKHSLSRSNNFSLGDCHEVAGSLNTWVSIPAEPTWLRVQLDRTRWGTIQDFLYRSAEAVIEIRLKDGETEIYRLPTGYARAGFIINPVLRTDLDLLGSGPKQSITAVRVYSPNSWFFRRSVRFVKQTVQGVAALKFESVQPEPELAAARRTP